MAPRDPDAGGSWIAASESGVTFCLLNAAHVDPGRLSARPPSRGSLIDAVAPLTSPADVESALRGGSPPIDGMRGFHLVIVLPASATRDTGTRSTGERSARARASAVRGSGASGAAARGFAARGSGASIGATAIRFRWDGRSLQRDEHETPGLFVSSGYDQAGAEAARGRTWRAFLAGLRSTSRGRSESAAPASRPDLEALLASHEPSRGVLSICMHGDVARTVSRTIVSVGTESITMTYRAGAPCDPAAKEYQVECSRGSSG